LNDIYIFVEQIGSVTATCIIIFAFNRFELPHFAIGYVFPFRF